MFPGDLLILETGAEGTPSKRVVSSADSPIFIVGLSRSGTSLLSRMLDAHPDIAILPETWWYVVLDGLGCLGEFSNPWQTSLFFNEVWGNLKSYPDSAAQVVAREASKDPRYVGPTVRVLEKLGQAYANERRARIWGEKTPSHALWLPQIRDLFPRARVLFSLRDPRDVLVSYDDRWNDGRRDTDYLISTAALLKHYLTYLLHYPGFPPEQIRWVKYELLTAQPAEELEKICSFLGVDFDPSMLAFYHRQANLEQDMSEGQHHALLSKPVTTDQIGRYQTALSPNQIALVERFLGEEMRTLGYRRASNDLLFTAHETKAYANAEIYYLEMSSGVTRRRLRRRGKLKLRAYQWFGRALGLFPFLRVATTGEDWQLLADEAASSFASPRPAADPGNGKAPNAFEARSFRTEMGRISRQSGIVFAGIIFNVLFGYAFKIYLAHALGAEVLGLYALGITLISLLGTVCALGLPESAVRFVALYSASKKFEELRALLWNGSWILIATNLIFGVLLLKFGPWIATQFYHSPQLARYLPLFATIMIATSVIGFLGDVLAGYRDVGSRTLIREFVASPVTIALSVLFITLGAGLWGYLAAQIVSAVCALILLISVVWQLTPIAARSPNLKRLWIGSEVWSFSAAMFGVGLMGFFLSQADFVALGVYRSAHEVGVYTVAAALVTYEMIIHSSVSQIFAPVIADVHARGEQVLLGRLFQTLNKWIFGLTFPLAMVLLVYARPIMGLFGHDFEAGWPILVIGTCGQLVNCGVGSVGYLLLTSGHQRRLLRVQIVMAAVMVALSFKLVPVWGAVGAAVAAGITNVAMNVWNLVEVHKALKLAPYNRSYLKLLPSLGGVLIVTLLVSKTSGFLRADLLGIGAALVLAYVVFCWLIYAVGLDVEDRLIADAVWARLRPIFGR